MKVKNKKSNLSDSYAKRRKQQMQKKSITPFEVHINRDKQNVLGRKSKADKGLPGIARTKAIAKRKNTLLLEYKVKDKDNIFLDRRIGEKNSKMSQEDKAMARFAAERVKSHSKKNIFNLNDDEILTHRGQSLIDIEKYDDPRSDEESDGETNKSGKLNKNFVEDAHFGGGVLSKPDSEMSRKDVIEQLIADSKKRKAERQKIREETIDLTEKLDTEWRDLLPIVACSNKALEKAMEEEKPIEKPKIDDYDLAMRQLKFEPRGGMPSDKLKSEEEIAKGEKAKLEKLEEDRLARMKGFTDDAQTPKHRSADDLDNFHIEQIVEESSDDESHEKKGILINGELNKIEKNDLKDKKVDDKNVKEDEENDEDDEEDDEEENEEDDEEEDEEEDEDSESSEESQDDLSDLKASESESEMEDEKNEVTIKNQKELVEEEEKEQEEEEDEEEEEEEEEEKEKVVYKKTEISKENTFKEKIVLEKSLKNSVIVEAKKTNNSEKSNEISEIVNDVNIKEKEAIMEKARKELPYTYEAPETFEQLKNLFKNQNPEYQSVITERIIKCNHWKLLEKNKEKLLNLFSYLLQYLDECASINSVKDSVKFFQTFSRLCPHLYDLAHGNPLGTKICLQEILKKKHEEFQSNIKVYPGLDTLFLFKLVSILYPTSDFRHPIVTPCLVFMSQILLRCKIKGKHDISKGLFVVTLILEYTVLSKRWSPTVINFLRGVIYVSLPKPFTKVIKAISPFKTVGEFSNILVLEKNHKKEDIDPATVKMHGEDFIKEDMDDDYRIRTFVTALNLLNEFTKQCSELEAVYSLFSPISSLLKCGSVKRYPEKIREHVKNLINSIEKFNEKELEYLQFAKKKPKALRMYEPRIEVVHDGKRHKPMSKERAEREKLLHKLKRETKSAIREVRRDSAFISKVKIKQQIASDAERKRKVKEIFGDAAMQQHELKKFKKK